ncbi:uncharacterized protein PV09_02311 [Verruconis gallopava]|uniref:Uncharacterized protein n=1 Tax=Verruconis gallopava TaxID=253628 RepID=A0A0D2AJ76_9PEZI|nr:uncharacterized protein PV09_02311 [Verruconis gallopava]KIW06595.1 hypothetical protein PV09_02311 [Verruconis gallopava]
MGSVAERSEDGPQLDRLNPFLQNDDHDEEERSNSLEAVRDLLRDLKSKYDIKVDPSGNLSRLRSYTKKSMRLEDQCKIMHMEAQRLGDELSISKYLLYSEQDKTKTLSSRIETLVTALDQLREENLKLKLQNVELEALYLAKSEENEGFWNDLVDCTAELESLYDKETRNLKARIKELETNAVGTSFLIKASSSAMLPTTQGQKERNDAVFKSTVQDRKVSLSSSVAMNTEFRDGHTSSGPDSRLLFSDSPGSNASLSPKSLISDHNDNFGTIQENDQAKETKIACKYAKANVCYPNHVIIRQKNVTTTQESERNKTNLLESLASDTSSEPRKGDLVHPSQAHPTTSPQVASKYINYFRNSTSSIEIPPMESIFNPQSSLSSASLSTSHIPFVAPSLKKRKVCNEDKFDVKRARVYESDTRSISKPHVQFETTLILHKPLKASKMVRSRRQALSRPEKLKSPRVIPEFGELLALPQSLNEGHLVADNSSNEELNMKKSQLNTKPVTNRKLSVEQAFNTDTRNQNGLLYQVSVSSFERSQRDINLEYLKEAASPSNRQSRLEVMLIVLRAMAALMQRILNRFAGRFGEISKSLVVPFHKIAPKAR